MQEIKAYVASKTKVPQPTWMMVRQVTQEAEGKEGLPTEWLSHWDNDHRIRVTMHEDVLDYIKNNPQCGDLIVTEQKVAQRDADAATGVAARAAYVRFVISHPTSVEAVF